MRLFRPAIGLTIIFFLVTGLIFPWVVWGLSQALFPHQAGGSLIRSSDGSLMGSELIGQPFMSARYFHPRPSAAGSGYDAGNSSGTNLGPTSDKLINGVKDDPATAADESFDGVKQLAQKYRLENGLSSDAVVPVDAVTRSASGLDPHISVQNAMLQAKRVSAARGLAQQETIQAIEKCTEGRWLGIFGESRVNVLELNLWLDSKSKSLRNL